MRMECLPLRPFSFTVFLCLVAATYQYEFNKNYFGVIFAPNGKLFENGSYPSWDNYTFFEVQQILSVISTRFKNIALFTMGVSKVEAKSWEEGESIGLTGVAAARLNELHNKTLIRVSLGVNQYDDLKQETEIKIALQVTKEANAIHRGTIWGITLTFFYIKDFPTSRRVLDLINVTRQLAKADKEIGKIEIGTRLWNCHNLIEAYKDVSFLIDVIKNLDYILCHLRAENWAVGRSMKYVVQKLGETFIQTKNAIRQINPNVSVIFETGWPSQGVMIKGLVASIENLKNFWEQMDTWATANQFPLHMLEALDQPWKTHALDDYKEIQDRTNPMGICGSEPHYGWWRRTTNYKYDATAYVEKITEPQRLACDEIETPLAFHLIIGVSLVVIVILLLIYVILFLYRRLRTAKDELLTEKEIEEFERGLAEFEGEAEHNDMSQLLPYDRKFELEKDKFSIDRNRILGSGQFGVVYKGKIEGKNGSVAFKMPKPHCPVQSLKSLLSEIKLMIYIGSHPNIVCLLGAHTGEIREGGVYIASEYCAYGSLEKVLQSIAENKEPQRYENTVTEKSIYANEEVKFQRYVNYPTPITALRPESIVDGSVMDFNLSVLLKWASQIADGMAHLVLKKVIHADLAARNVLVTGDGTAKITDFGLSRKLYAYTEYVKQNEEPLPWRWMAMESLKKLTFSAKSDTWSYGVTVWEIFTLGDIPYPGLAWEIGFIDKLIAGLRLQKPKYASPEIYQMMVKCWKPEPKERPDFDELAVFFKELIAAQDCIDNDKS